MDVRTLYFLVGSIFLLTPLAVLYALRTDRDSAVLLWFISWPALGIAALLLAARETVPMIFSFHVAHLMLMVSYVTRTSAITWELSHSRQAWMQGVRMRILIAGLYLIVFALIIAFDLPEELRLTFVHSFNFLTFIEFFMLSLQLTKRLRSRGGQLIVLMAAFMSFGFGVRLLGVLSGSGGLGPFGPGIDQTVILLSLVIGYICGNFGFLQIRVERMVVSRQEILEKLNDLKVLNTELDQALLRKNELLGQLSRLNSATQSGVLVSAIVHEITQPLGALTLNAQFVRRKIYESAFAAELRAVADDLLVSLERINELVNSIRGLFLREVPKFNAVNLSQSALDVCDLFESQCASAGILLTRKIEPGIQVKGDEVQMRMVMMNLLQNAISALRSTSSPKEVKLTLKQSGQRVILTVADSGPGVDPELVSRMWALYMTNKAGGSGIGLWLCRLIAEHHQGSIRYNGKDPKGAQFTVDLPALIL